MATKSEEGETKEETYQNIVNVREEYAGKADLLLKEATGRDSATEAFDETQVSKIVCKDDEVMVLQLKNERLGPVWRPTQWLSKRRTVQLVIPNPRGGARAEGGLVVTGVANQREGRAIVQGDVVVGQMEEKGP